MTQPARTPDPAPATGEAPTENHPMQSFNEFLMGPPYFNIDIPPRPKEPIRPFDFDLEDSARALPH